MNQHKDTSADDFSLYLASSSPRRRELLTQIGVSYRLIAADVDETVLAGEDPHDHVSRLALAKARAGQRRMVADGLQQKPVLGADTVVVVDGDIMGKPEGREQGLAMLAKLSGRSHQVMSGVALVGESEQLRVNTSTVWFRSTHQHERETYWDSGEPADKAGAYAVQGHAAVFISRIEGSFSGIMGLPLYETYELLAAAGIQTL